MRRDSPQLAQLIFQLDVLGIPTPDQEYLFAPPVGEMGREFKFKRRRWRFDLAWPCAWRRADPQVRVPFKFAVELDGSVFTGGRHGGTPSAIRDIEKQNAAQLLGWTVLHVVPAQVKSGEAARLVEVAFGLRSLDDILYARQK